MARTVLILSNEGLQDFTQRLAVVLDRSMVRVDTRRPSNLIPRLPHERRIDILLLDERAFVSVDAIRQVVSDVHRVWKDTRILVVGEGSIEGLIRAARSNTGGYLMLQASDEEIRQALCCDSVGQAFVLPHRLDTAHLIYESLDPAHSGGSLPLEELTPRERDVMHLLVQGMDNRELADRLSVSITTVKWHVRNLLQKFESRHRSELICRWYSGLYRNDSAGSSHLPEMC